MSGIRIEGNTSGNVAEVDSNNQVKMVSNLNSTLVGFETMSSETDPGSISGVGRFMRDLYSSDDYRLQVGQVTPLFDYQFVNTAQDTNYWYYKFATMTATQGSGWLLMNANSSTANANYCFMQSWRYVKVMANAEVYVELVINLTAVPLANQVVEFGLFLGTVATAPADGVYFRLTSAGLIGIVNNNGSETPTGVIPVALTPGVSYRLGINITQKQVEFWYSNGTAPNYSTDILGAILMTAAGNVQPFASTALPICIQFRNSGLVSASPQMQFKVGSTRVEQSDLALGAPYSHIQAAAGLNYQGQPGGMQGPDNYYTASVAPTPFAWVAAATGAMAGIGGIAVCNPSTAAGTDGVIFSYQNPAGGVSQVPRTLIITGVQVQSAVSTILANTSALALAYSVGFGHTAATLATTTTSSFTTVTTKAPRIIPIGFETYAINAAVGVVGSSTGIILDLSQSPIVVNPSEYIALVVRNVGGVTTSGAITVLCTMKHYWI